MGQDGMEIEDEREEVFQRAIIFRDIFGGNFLQKGYSKREFFRKKFDYFQKLIADSSKYYYSHERDKNIDKDAILLSNVSSLTSQEGEHTVLGLIYKLKGVFYI